MTYDTIFKAKEVFRDYKDLKESPSIEWFSYSDKVNDLKIGDFILFQHIKSMKISRPILGVFVGYSFWDMALVMNFVEVPRAFCYSDKYLISVNNAMDFTEYIGHQEPQIENIQFWTDNIHLLGIFKGKPNLKELRNSMVKIIN